MTRITPKILGDGVLLDADTVLELPLGGAVKDLAKDEQGAAALLALDDLWQDGYLDATSSGQWVVPFERLIHIDASVAHALRLPIPDPRIHAELRSTGIATNRDFGIQLELSHPQHGRLDPERQRGPANIVVGGECVVLTPQLWRLATRVAERPADNAATEDRFEYLSRCVEAARDAKALIDDYLRDNALEVLTEVELDATEVGDEIHLGASSGGLSSKDLVLPNGKARPFPQRILENGSRKRVVLSSVARTNVEALSSNKVLRGADVPRFLQNPEAFVPDGIDLTNFSERVRGFNTRVYNSRPYLHVNKAARGWLDPVVGVILESTIGESDGNSISVEEFREIADEALRTGERFVRRGNDWVEVDPVQAEQFLNTVDRVTELRSREPRPTVRLLLDVIPNLDLLEFEVLLPDEVTSSRPWFDELPEAFPPSSFRAHLDDHQLLGFRWLTYLHDRCAGGLLADEMGVGKTAQIIAHFAKLFEENQLSPALVVLPKTLIPNWIEELTRFAPSIDKVHIHSGGDRTSSASFLGAMNIVITTYDTARQDQIMLGSIDWTVVVADEAQFIKNPTAARTSVVKALKARQALALTGTPVENGLIEFWCIMDYVQPGLLKSWAEFRNEYERPLVEARAPGERESLAQQLLSSLDPHFLRRLKEEVLSNLPEKRIADPVYVPLSPLQRSRYQDILTDAKEGGRGVVLGAITRLLMTCAHPRASVGDWIELDGDTLINECPKLAATMGILDEVKQSDQKALVFTTWKGTQKILQKAIWSRFGVVAEIVNGDITSRRQEVIDQFRHAPGFGVLILAPEVAGFGLNLVEANHVIHYTRPWNPAKENQATDRAHRRGQVKPVTVYYPIVAGTVEEKLAQLLAEKSQLTQDVLRPTNERTVTVDDLIEDIELKEAS